MKGLFANQMIAATQFVDMQRSIRDFTLQQGRCERIKDFPYPRRFTAINSLFTKLFCALLPFGFLREFDNLNEASTGYSRDA